MCHFKKNIFDYILEVWQYVEVIFQKQDINVKLGSLYTHVFKMVYGFFKIKFKQFLNFWANIERNYTFFFRFIIQSKQYLARSLKWMCLTASRDCFVKTIFYTCDARWLVLRSIEVLYLSKKNLCPVKYISMCSILVNPKWCFRVNLTL